MRELCSIIVLIDKYPNCTTTAGGGAGAGILCPVCRLDVLLCVKASVYRESGFALAMGARAKRKRAAALEVYPQPLRSLALSTTIQLHYRLLLLAGDVGMDGWLAAFCWMLSENCRNVI